MPTFGPYTRTAAEEISGVPVNHVAPVIEETSSPGSYICLPGLWSHRLTSPAVTYQWTRDGAAISGATAETYSETIADFGTMLTCEVSVAGVVAVAAPVAVAADFQTTWGSAPATWGAAPTTWGA
jgi:hypothetical protein